MPCPFPPPKVGLCSQRPEEVIACVTHGGILAMTFGRPGHPGVTADEGTRRRFTNCELRTCELTAEEGPAGGLPHFRLKLLPPVDI